jgi:hypothetical protein
MRRWVALGLFILTAGCAAPAELAGLLPLFRADPPKLDLIQPGPDQLAGADPARVNLILGTPDLVRRDGPAEIWHYSGEGCRLLVFLYDEDSGDKPNLERAKIDRADRKGMTTLTRANLAVNAPYGSAAVRHVAVWPSSAEEAPCVTSITNRVRAARLGDQP